jgi:hypothetical protein
MASAIHTQLAKTSPSIEELREAQLRGQRGSGFAANFAEWAIDCIDWLIDWLIEWLNDWLIEWLIDWIIMEMRNMFTGYTQSAHDEQLRWLTEMNKCEIWFTGYT